MIARAAKIVAFVLAGAALAGCAGPAPKEAALSATQVQTFTVQQAEIDVSAIGAASRGRAVPADAIKTALENRTNLVKWQGGNTPAVVRVSVTSVNIISAGQTMLVGGESVMEGTVALHDARTGNVIVAPIEISSGGGGYTPGGLIGLASMEDKNTELEQLAQQFMTRARLALTGPTNQAQN